MRKELARSLASRVEMPGAHTHDVSRRFAGIGERVFGSGTFSLYHCGRCRCYLSCWAVRRRIAEQSPAGIHTRSATRKTRGRRQHPQWALAALCRCAAPRREPWARRPTPSAVGTAGGAASIAAHISPPQPVPATAEEAAIATADDRPAATAAARLHPFTPRAARSPTAFLRCWNGRGVLLSSQPTFHRRSRFPQHQRKQPSSQSRLAQLLFAHLLLARLRLAHLLLARLTLAQLPLAQLYLSVSARRRRRGRR